MMYTHVSQLQNQVHSGAGTADNEFNWRYFAYVGTGVPIPDDAFGDLRRLFPGMESVFFEDWEAGKQPQPPRKKRKRSFKGGKY